MPNQYAPPSQDTSRENGGRGMADVRQCQNPCASREPMLRRAFSVGQECIVALSSKAGFREEFLLSSEFMLLPEYDVYRLDARVGEHGFTRNAAGRI